MLLKSLANTFDEHGLRGQSRLDDASDNERRRSSNSQPSARLHVPLHAGHLGAASQRHSMNRSELEHAGSTGQFHPVQESERVLLGVRYVKERRKSALVCSAFRRHSRFECLRVNLRQGIVPESHCHVSAEHGGHRIQEPFGPRTIRAFHVCELHDVNTGRLGSDDVPPIIEFHCKFPVNRTDGGA